MEKFTVAKQPLVQEIAELKRQPGGDMVVFGGAAFVADMAKEGLIDEYRFKLEPVVLGKGKPLFKDISTRIHLRLVRSKPFSSGVVGLTYEVVR